MKIVLKKKTSPKVKARTVKRARVRKKVTGSVERPRVSIFKSNTRLLLQLISDDLGKTLLALDTKKLNKRPNRDGAKDLGSEFGRQMIEKGFKRAVFDRGGYAYHGKIEAVAEGLRSAGVIL